MHDGHVEDSKMNTKEKDFGILVSENLDDFGKCKRLPYIKDKDSRTYTSGTPVKFVERDFDTGIPLGYKKGNAIIKVAEITRIDKRELRKQPIVRNLNVYAKVLLELDPKQLRALTKVNSEEIEEALKEAIDKLTC